MKIVLLVRSLGCGGAERQLVRLATQLASRHDVAIMTFYADDGFFRPELEGTAVRLISLDKRGRWDVLVFVRRFMKEIATLKPDVIYGFMNTAGLVALVARFSRRRCRLVWGIRNSNMDLARYGRLPRMLRRVECLLSSRADLVISNSEAGRSQAITDGFRRDIIVVPNGIDTSRFVRDEEAGRRVRRQWGVPDASTLIGIVARHDTMKGYDTFLRAAALYLAVNADVYFVSVGDGHPEYTRSLKALADELQLGTRMIWAGRTLDVVPCYSALDLMTSSSSFGEGFSNAVAEAMACGVPCVVTDVGDSRLIVGETGLVVPPNSPGALSEGWRAMCDMPVHVVQTRHSEVRKRIVEEFSDVRMVTRTEAALMALCAAGGA